VSGVKMDGIDRKVYPYSIQLLASPVTVISLVLQDDVHRMVILQARYRKQSKPLISPLQERN
jgi:hypothetical protein